MQFYFSYGIKAKTVLISSISMRIDINRLIFNIIYFFTLKISEDG